MAAVISARRFLDRVQDYQYCSEGIGTLRGLHFQRPPFAQAKLIRVLSVAILDVVVDVRRLPPTFGKHVSVKLDSESDDLRSWLLNAAAPDRGRLQGRPSLRPDP